jgi:PIN domain nuclease of toxin-antitoxin system
VARFDAAVTDTHALLYHLGGSRKLGLKAAAAFQAAEEGRGTIYVPMPVVMEVGFLARAGRAKLSVPAFSVFDVLFANAAYQPLDLSLEQLRVADALRFNRDPYDAMIVAAALVLGLPLITRDTAIVESGAVKVLW